MQWKKKMLYLIKITIDLMFLVLKMYRLRQTNFSNYIGYIILYNTI